MALYQTQPDRKLRAKALAKEYGIGGHSHDFLDGSGGFVNHDWKGLEFDHYPDHQKITLKWAQVEKYIDLMIQSDRYLTDEEKEQCTTVQEENGYKVGDDVMVDLPTGTIEGTIGYIGETDVRIDTSAHGQSWDNEVINKRQFEDGLRQNEPSQRVDEMLEQAETIYKESEVPEYERFSVREVVGGTSQLFAIWDDLNEGYYANDNGMAQFTDKEQAESYCTALKKETDERTAADWLAVEKAKFLAENEPVPALPKERDYRVGDTIRLDGKDFTVETVGTLNIQLRDPDEVYPVARSESKENLERLLRQPGNIHLHNLTVNLTPAPEPAGNFRITDDHLGEGGAKQKYARNIEAIRTLFKLEQEHRGATTEEQQLLSQYVGWGGLADAFDPNKAGWAKEYTELKGLLSEDEYAAARSSTLNAHYTSPVVIRSIYDAVEKMGFRSGNILEPSMGVGNFFGMLPDTMQDSRLYGVELDSITGRIAQKLYPQADITVAGFETTDRRDFYDLAVGNVPFGNYKVADKAYNKLGFSIHNYFFAKAIDQVRPGGVVAFVTSRYTIRYTCYGKLRKQTNCTGQTGYTVHILDEIIDKAVRQIFSKMRGIPKEQIVTKRYEKETTERKNHLQDLQTQRDKAEKDLLSLKAEILACIKGESVLPRETLAEMITEQEEKLKELEDLCESASEELERTAELMDKVSRLYDELISYADLYDSANFEAKKMVVNQLIRRVDVYRGYQINISFNFDLTPYIEGE